MAIQHNFSKKQDNHIIEVEQNATYELYYLSDKSNEKLSSGILFATVPFTIPVYKDGNYQLRISATGETTVIINFDVFKYLQDSIIREAKSILCCTEVSNCTEPSSNCLSKAGKKCLTHKSIFVKLLSFQSLAVPTYGVNYPNTFTSFISAGVQAFQCKVQTTINNILKEECITGTVKDVDSLFKVYVALYWAGMYFIEEKLAGLDEVQLVFIKTKFKYNEILNCMCSTCIDITALKDLFDNSSLPIEIYSFQFDNLTDNITNAVLVTDTYLTTQGTLQIEDDLVAGKQITYTNIGRIGFAITNNRNGYKFLDSFGNDITDAVFDRVYDELRAMEIFISKDYITPSTIYYKFLKI